MESLLFGNETAIAVGTIFGGCIGLYIGTKCAYNNSKMSGGNITTLSLYVDSCFVTCLSLVAGSCLGFAIGGAPVIFGLPFICAVGATIKANADFDSPK